jgi:hypothetical protein
LTRSERIQISSADMLPDRCSDYGVVRVPVYHTRNHAGETLAVTFYTAVLRR